jgi:hypothetical protein
MMKNLSRALVATIALLPVVTYGRNARVHVSVQATSGHGLRITSLINKELRALGDVDLGEGQPDFNIEILAIEEARADGTSTGMLAVAVNFLSPLKGLEETLASGSKCLPLAERDRLKALSTVDARVQLLVFSVPASEVERLAKDIVSSFDVRCLQPARNRHNAA